MARSKDDEDAGVGLTILKMVLMGLGGIVALGIVFAVMKPLIFVGALAGAGYLGYKLMSKGRALPAGKTPRALSSGRDRDSQDPDFDRRMKQLEEIEKRLDAEIGKY